MTSFDFSGAIELNRRAFQRMNDEHDASVARMTPQDRASYELDCARYRAINTARCLMVAAGGDPYGRIEEPCSCCGHVWDEFA